MADFKLKSGREIVFDFDAITLKELRVLENTTNPPTKEESDPLFARVCGITVDELEAIGSRDFMRLRRAFWKAAYNPLDDPN